MRWFALWGALGLALMVVARPAAAAVDVQVNLSSQTMRVTSNRGETYVWPVSTARAGYVTPRGVYRAQSLARMHYSRKYDNAPMPHSIFFRGGYAIHGTNAVGSLGRPASHGCIRLAPGNAARLFAMVRQEGGARISISGAPAHASAKAKTYAAAPHGGARPMAYAPRQKSRADRSLRSWFADPGWR